MKTYSPKAQAFTLIELLVVIAIIAILAAILFPVFAQAKQAAKKTADLSNLKNINMGNQIYLSDFDDVWVPWTSGANCGWPGGGCTPGTDINWDDGSAFGLRYMYANTLQPYIKSGISSGKGELKDIWASPLSKGYFPSSKYLYAYNYYALGGFSRCMSPITPTSSATCYARSADRWGPFADTSYNTPAPATSLTDPAGTLAFADGNILARPPQAPIAQGWSDWEYIFTGIWGAAEPGDGIFNGKPVGDSVNAANDDSGCAPGCAEHDVFTSADYTLATGGKTVVAYADSHVKTVNTGTLYYVGAKTSKWVGGLSDNKGWQR
jgi:prepilin-type N-terminal cleavage/methylation domain-containing protein